MANRATPPANANAQAKKKRHAAANRATSDRDRSATACWSSSWIKANLDEASAANELAHPGEPVSRWSAPESDLVVIGVGIQTNVNQPNSICCLQVDDLPGAAESAAHDKTG